MYKDNIYDKQQIFNRNDTSITSNKKMNDVFLFTSIEVIEELLNNFFKNSLDKKIAFLFYHNIHSKNSCEKVTEIILSKLKFIKINVSKLMLYKSPLFFLFKQIIKNLPFVLEKDKKILWDRLFLFLKSFDLNISLNTKIQPAEIIFSDINYDDPIELIRKEIADILRVYNINKFINIYLEDFDQIEFQLINKFYKFISILFGEFIQFKFIAQIYKIEVAQNLNTKFPGNNDYTQLVNFIFKNSYNYFICDEINNSNNY